MTEDSEASHPFKAKRQEERSSSSKKPHISISRSVDEIKTFWLNELYAGAHGGFLDLKTTY